MSHYIINMVLRQLMFIIVTKLILIKLYTKWSLGWCYSNVSLVGKTVIVTGANQGLGYETALDFAKRGARVILACRNEKAAEEACAKIVYETRNKNILVKIIDLSSFDSVRKFAKNILETENRLDVLVNNAGILTFEENHLTIDGNGLNMQVNYYSPFLLTNLLLELMKKTKNSRVVNVASVQAIHAVSTQKLDLLKRLKHGEIINVAFISIIYTINFFTKKFKTFPGFWAEYNNAKLYNILFTQELAKRLDNCKVATFSLNPGIIDTHLFKNLRFIDNLIRFLLKSFVKNQREGAQTTIYCALEKDIEKYSGEYFSDCKRVPPYWNAKNPKLSQELWDKTELIVRLKEK